MSVRLFYPDDLTAIGLTAWEQSDGRAEAVRIAQALAVVSLSNIRAFTVRYEGRHAADVTEAGLPIPWEAILASMTLQAAARLPRSAFGDAAMLRYNMDEGTPTVEELDALVSILDRILHRIAACIERGAPAQ